MSTPLRLFRIIHKATESQWTAFPPDWARYGIKGLVSDEHGREFHTNLSWRQRDTCELLLRTDIRGPFDCSLERFVHCLAEASTVNLAASAMPHGEDAVTVQGYAHHAAVETGLDRLAVELFRRFKKVLNSHGVQTLLAMSKARTNYLEARAW